MHGARPPCQYEGINRAALARALNIKSTTLLRLLERLEGVGFIARIPDPRDPQAHVLALAAGALPMIERIYELTRRVYDEAQLGFPMSRPTSCSPFFTV